MEQLKRKKQPNKNKKWYQRIIKFTLIRVSYSILSSIHSKLIIKISVFIICLNRFRELLFKFSSRLFQTDVSEKKLSKALGSRL